ncbi:GntR family transcriptional regulator [Jiella avicenniae]|uniref:GntR family transcriptional regulator n=1 Tax=Jiella avicenniae TaxID=2907202 RepID=A0A9X1P425_9HYPH|nr:GntR family transcriptional regulator [Jiella avicenniae]MCE7029459.1 GntR family transcriptional regulator [Jiella avicenniae]
MNSRKIRSRALLPAKLLYANIASRKACRPAKDRRDQHGDRKNEHDIVLVNPFINAYVVATNKAVGVSTRMKGLVDDAYGRLKKEIMTSGIPAGLQATEQEFADRFGVSRTPMREALLRLSAEGLVELIPRRGARILSLSVEDMREVYDILIALEPEAAARVAASTVSEEALSGLEDATKRMEEALEKDDLDAWASADTDFHEQLLRLCGNARMQRIIRTLLDQSHRARSITLRLRSKPHQSTQEHREIIECIRRGDLETTRRTFREHRVRAADELMAILENMKHLRL